MHWKRKACKIASKRGVFARFWAEKPCKMFARRQSCRASAVFCSAFHTRACKQVCKSRARDRIWDEQICTSVCTLVCTILAEPCKFHRVGEQGLHGPCTGLAHVCSPFCSPPASCGRSTFCIRSVRRPAARVRRFFRDRVWSLERPGVFV